MFPRISPCAFLPIESSKLHKAEPTDYSSTNSSSLLHRLGNTQNNFEHRRSTAPLIVLAPKPGITPLRGRPRPRASDSNRAGEGRALFDSRGTFREGSQ
jgi:hypothetical protein